MSKRTMGIILIILGVIAVVISLTADVTGVGNLQGDFGWKQQLGTATGIIAAIIGVWLVSRKISKPG